jgi:hypothetical protein
VALGILVAGIGATYFLAPDVAMGGGLGPFLVGLDHDHLVSLARGDLDERSADLPRTDDDVHSVSGRDERGR